MDGGPTAEQLVVDEPDLSGFGVREIQRVAVVVAVVVVFTLRSALRWLPRRRGAFSDAVANGIIDGFIHLGPTFVKLGQVMASSPGLFPEWLSGPARRCLDQVPPFPTPVLRATIEEDLGAPIESVFAEFDDVPLSAASIGQVHACVLSDGREAVVKVQRPGLRRAMTRDLRVLHSLAELAHRFEAGRSSNVRGMVEDLNALTAKELNPVVEAWNQQRFRDHLWSFGDNLGVTVPEVYWEHCGLRTICMERVYGTPMDDFDELEARGVDAELVLRRGAKAWTEAMLLHGPFHGDLHAGNIWVLDDGRGCFLDFGIMGELTEEWRALARDLYFTCVFDRDYSRMARAYRSVGVFPDGMGTDEEIGERIGMILDPMLGSGIGDVALGDLITSSVELMRDFGGTPPRELLLVGKQLLYIERYAKRLAPQYRVVTDPFLVRNVFPDATADYLASGGLPFPE